MSIVVRNLNKSINKKEILKDLSFEVSSGGITGFLGPNGAGKSTAMKILVGALKSDSGLIEILDNDVNREPTKTKQNIGYLPETNPLYNQMYVGEYLLYVADIYRLKNIQKKVRDVIDLCEIGNEYKKKIGTLSKGYKQRVGLAQALIHNPSVLILDEPTSGFDPNQLIDFRKLLTEIGRDRTVLFSTHIMQEVEALCKDIIIINQGEIVAQGSKETIMEQLDGSKIQYIVETENNVELSGIHGEINIPFTITKISETKYQVVTNSLKDIRPYIFNYFVDHKAIIVAFYKKDEKFENIFHKLV